MTALGLLLALSLTPAQDGSVLRVGEVVSGTISEDDPTLETVTFDEVTYRIYGHTYRIEGLEPGRYRVDLYSLAFDGFLILRTPDGRVVATNDSSGSGLDPVLQLEFAEGDEYVLQAGARVVGGGPYELELGEGWQSEEERRRLFLAIRDDMAVRLAWLEEHAPDSPALAYALFLHAGSESLNQRHQEALPFSRRAAEISARALGPEHPLTLQFTDRHANIAAMGGDCAGAVHYWQRNIPARIAAFGEDHASVAACRANLAECLSALGRSAEAMEELQLALPTLERVAAERPEPLAVALTKLGDVQKSFRLYEASLDSYRRALETYGRVEEPTRYFQTLASIEMSIAQHYEMLGELDRARPFAERAMIRIEERFGPSYPLTASYSASLARILLRSGDAVTALELAERAVSVHEQYGTRGLSWSYACRGDVKMVLERYADAADDYASALDVGTPSGVVRNRWRLDHAFARFLAGDHAQARADLERVLEDERRRAGDDSLALNVPLILLGRVLNELGERESAIEMLRQGIALAEESYGRSHSFPIDARRFLAAALAAEGRYEEAWSELRSRSAERREYVARTLSIQSDAERHAFLAKAELNLRSLVSVAARLDDRAVREETYAEVLTFKGWAGRLLVVGRARVAQGSGGEADQRLEAVRAVQRELASLALDVEAASRDDFDERLRALRAELRRLERELHESTGPVIVDPGSPAELRAGLPPGSAVVDLLTHERTFAWISRAGGDDVSLVDLGPTSRIEAAVNAHLSALRGHAADDGANERLRELLWQPIAAELGDAERVFVSPDGLLGALPFETLRLESGAFLVEELAFVYTQDVSSLAALAQAEGDARFDSLLACGGLDFDGEPEEAPEVASTRAASTSLRGSFTTRWNALPGTADEVSAVAELHASAYGERSRATVLRGVEATEERLKREVADHSVLHLATHGFFQPEGLPSMWTAARDAVRGGPPTLREEQRKLVGFHPGLLTGLVCSGANARESEAGDDGYLTAAELRWLDLSGVELVVLSACETALGRPQSGEGLLGLRRACHMAGADTVISSLWTVADDSTYELMTAFYENLWRGGQGRHDALRAAQLEMIARRRPPSAWGGFVLSGDWR